MSTLCSSARSLSDCCSSPFQSGPMLSPIFVASQCGHEGTTRKAIRRTGPFLSVGERPSTSFGASLPFANISSAYIRGQAPSERRSALTSPELLVPRMSPLGLHPRRLTRRHRNTPSRTTLADAAVFALAPAWAKRATCSGSLGPLECAPKPDCSSRLSRTDFRMVVHQHICAVSCRLRRRPFDGETAADVRGLRVWHTALPRRDSRDHPPKVALACRRFQESMCQSGIRGSGDRGEASHGYTILSASSGSICATPTLLN